MNVLKYISQNGIKHTTEIIYMYKIDTVGHFIIILLRMDIIKNIKSFGR